MREFKASTKAGQRIIEMGDRCTYTDLSDIYQSFSERKECAFKWCLEQFREDEGVGFGIGSANTFGFTASWLLRKNNEICMRVETKDNSYLVWLER